VAAPLPGMTMLVCDVTDDASVTAMVAEVTRQTGRIDLLVSNAGSALIGAAEVFSTTQAKALFDINFFGPFHVTNAVLPVIRAQKSGRIVNISSVVGFIPSPFSTLYTATKHNIEGY
jgi:NAD(P)-dependent dehydrogenase (short-subunit alcohol dehydrogenase family)